MKRKTSLLLILIPFLTSCVGKFKEERDPALFSKQHIYDMWNCDMNCGLLVFPDEITSSMTNIEYFHRIRDGLFDSDGELFFQYTLPKDEYDNEIKRLENISLTITSQDGETFTQSIRVDTEHYPKKAYVTCEAFWDEYEYALIDDALCTITCVYTSYIKYDESKIDKAYLRSDMDEILDEKVHQPFSIYAHSFDGGESYDNIRLADYMRE